MARRKIVVAEPPAQIPVIEPIVKTVNPRPWDPYAAHVVVQVEPEPVPSVPELPAE